MTATRDRRDQVAGGPGIGERLAGLLADDPGARLAAATIASPAVDPISLYAAAVEADLEAALWLRPSERTAFVGVGRAWAAELEGETRFRDAEAAWRSLTAAAALDRPDDGPRGAGPVLLGGMGFTGRPPAADDAWGPFAASSLVLPGLILSVTPDGTTVTASVVREYDGDGTDGGDARALERRWTSLVERARELAPSPSGMVAMPVFAPLSTAAEQPSHDHFRRLVGMYAGAVGRGRIDKVVLARRVDLRSPVVLDVPNALRRLAASAPESTTYAFRRDGRTFLGATPERLVRTEGRTFRTVAVAGTIRRGADEAEDAELGRRLLASEKDREEHAIVVAAIRDLLAPVADTLTVAPHPGVMTLRFVQHLVTEIAGTVPDGTGLLALGERLHPTPAVGGDPRDVALALIDEHEGFDRGWYAGPIGWLGVDGDGELCVALRCGIADRTNATLFAGCGIVADSDPDLEWEESRIKLRAVVSALGIPADEA
ncbi:MAG TPA: isochorismate synthase [Candidatus Limnocylindrales bacterium]|nr:isochorismate synthase [Candidatus Limnocylindrales bacterium]